MSDSTNKPGSGNSDGLDFESFFSQFEDLLSDSPVPSEPAKQERPAVQAEQPAVSVPSQEDAPEEIPVKLLDDEMREIDSLLADFTAPAVEESVFGPALDEPAPEAAPTEEKPAEEGFTVVIPEGDIKAGGASLESFENRASSVTYVPEAGVGFDVSDLPPEILGDDAPQSGSDVPPGDGDGKKKPAKKSSGDTARKVVFIIAIITIIGCLLVLGKLYFFDPYMATRNESTAQNDIIKETYLTGSKAESDMRKQLQEEFPGVEFPPSMLIKYGRLYAANQDLAGWINIPAFGIDMPLAQGKDNSEYLKKDIYKKWTQYGVPFIDYRNNTYFLDRNTVVYGHNMRYSDKIFGMLEDYKTVDGFKRAPVIKCNTIYDDYTWKVYAVFITNSAAKDDNGYVFNYTFTNLTNEKFESYIKEVDKRALYKTGVDMLPTDSILTLSTCCYDFDSAKLVVVARLLRDGESADVDTSKASANPNPKYPQAWYNSNNKTNPYAGDAKWYVD